MARVSSITLELHSHKNTVLSSASLNALCLLTGRKPATANQLHPRPRTNGSGSKANIGRELQLSPNLCVLRLQLQTARPHLNRQLSSLFCPSPVALFNPPPLLPPFSSTSVLHPLHRVILILSVYSRHFDILWREHIWKDKHTSALSPGHTSTTACAASGVSTFSFCFNIICSFIILLCFLTFMKLRLIIWAMHCQFLMLFICVFLENLFFKGEDKNVLFFIKDYLKFFTVMGGLVKKHCLPPREIQWHVMFPWCT